MAQLNYDIKVNITDGALGRLASGKDYYTGIIFQDASKPAGYGSDDIKRIYSLDQAVTLGITSALFPEAYYHLQQYFRVLDKLNVSGFIDVMFSNIVIAGWTATEIDTIQVNANYELRQIGVYLTDSFANSIVATLQTKAEGLDTQGYPCSIYLTADIADYTALTDLRAQDDKWVSVDVSQDGGGDGADLYTSEGHTIGSLGVMLAATAGAKVNESIGWVNKFDISGPYEYQTLAMADGTLLTAVTNAEIDTLDTQGYTVLVKRRVAGSYFYNNPTAAAATSDYTYQLSNRTIGKAKRLLLEYFAPYQNSPLFVDADTGKMTEQTIGVFDKVAREALQAMVVAGEIPVSQASGRLPDSAVTIDPDQDVVTASKVTISVKVGPTGVARDITIPLGFSSTN